MEAQTSLLLNTLAYRAKYAKTKDEKKKWVHELCQTLKRVLA